MEALAGSHQRPYVPNDRLRYMLIGYARVSKADGSQSLDLQRDALRAEGIDDPAHLYHDFASGVRDDRPGLDNCLRALRKGDILVAWKLDRLGRNLAHLAPSQDHQPHRVDVCHRQVADRQDSRLSVQTNHADDGLQTVLQCRETMASVTGLPPAG